MRLFDSSSPMPSVQIAKERLKSLVVSDRVKCEPDTYDQLSRELYRTVAKYMKVEEAAFDVDIARSRILITLTGEKH